MMDSPLPMIKNRQVLKAGVFSVGYQNGFIRQIHYGEIEVIRAIYMALRDQNWMTYEPIIENEKITQHEHSFEIQYDCFHELNGKRIFHWQVEIAGSADGVVSFETKGEALTDVLKNRAGICVLHPIKSTAGQPCEMLQTDGSHIKKSFPVMISAENPFKNLEGFRWRCQYDWYVLRFEGDAFETEDQRNWSDASYKTFSTPLEKPFPVLLKTGEKVYQKVMFQAESELLPSPEPNDRVIEILALQKKSKLPLIGIAASTEADEIPERCLQSLLALKLNHYRIEVRPAAPSWEEKFTRDCNQAEKIKLPLEVALYISSITELQEFYKTYLSIKPAIQSIILFSVNHPTTEQSLIDEIVYIKPMLPGVKIGAGTDYNFRELNTNRFNAESVDFVSYSIDPQEHTTDDLTIIENIEAQADTIRSARNIYDEFKPVHVTSLTLKKRFNPAATIAEDKILTNEKRADVRQQTSFCAVFTLGSIRSLSMADANSVTLYQTIGKQGILSESGDPYPVYDALKEILTTDKIEVVHTVSSKPLSCDALLLTDNNSYKLILANYTAVIQTVIFRKDTFELKPYEVRGIQL